MKSMQIVWSNASAAKGCSVMAGSDQPKTPPYKVKGVEQVLKSSDVQARVFTLAPGERIPWHYHRQSADHYFVLEGVLSVSTREPDVIVRRFPVGSSYKIAVGTPHLIANGGDSDCRFLLLQGVGAYDWIAAE
jgi:quercetin dioxygenase-like cupin family protein